MANMEAAREIPALQTADDPYEAAAGAHALIVATEWPEFADLDLERLKGVMASPVIVDARNILDADATRAAGFTYVSTGRPPDRQR